MSFMKPQIYRGGYFAVETSDGTEIVPADVIGRTMGTAGEAFENYVSGHILDTDECVEHKEGWLARMSAPGYMDCTDWTVHVSETAATLYLDEAYGE